MGLTYHNRGKKCREIGQAPIYRSKGVAFPVNWPGLGRSGVFGV